MKIIKWLVAISAFLSCPAMAQETPMTYDQYSQMAGSYHFNDNFISLDQFLEKMKEPGVVILDLRDDKAFNRSHIKDALHPDANATLADIHTAIPSKDATILLYNSNSLAPTTLIDARSMISPQLVSYGYHKIFTLAPVWANNPHYEDDLKKLPMTQGAAPAAPDASAWAACLGDYDCVVAEDDCPGTFIALNKKYLPEQEAKVNSRRPLIECAGAGPDVHKPSKSVCQSGACVAVP